MTAPRTAPRCSTANRNSRSATTPCWQRSACCCWHSSSGDSSLSTPASDKHTPASNEKSAIPQLLRQRPVIRRTRAVRREIEHVLAVHRAGRQRNSFTDARFTHQRTVAFPELVVYFVRQFAPRVEARHDHAPLELAVELALQHVERTIETVHTLQRQEVRRNGNQHPVGGEQRVQRQHAQHRAAVDQDGCAGQRQIVTQALAQQGGGLGVAAEHGVDLGEFQRSRDELPAAGGILQQVGKLSLVPEKCRHALVGQRPSRTAGQRQMPLRIHIQRDRALLRDIQRSRHIQAGRGLAYAALLIEYGDDRHAKISPEIEREGGKACKAVTPL